MKHQALKYLTRSLGAALVVGVLLAGCTKVSEPFYTVKSVVIDTTHRTVLLEDYTGHLCTNCAPAADQASAIQDAYKGRVFTISVHAGDFAKPIPSDPYFVADFRNETGNDWYNETYFNINVNPKGMVNRRPYKNNVSFGVTEWNEAVESALALPKVAIMSVGNTYNAATQTLDTKVDVRFVDNWAGDVTLTVCILEDSIVGGQKNNVAGYPKPMIPDFNFMHLLRGSMNGHSFGDLLASDPVAGDVVSRNFSYDLSTVTWVPRHCSVIAFISDATTREVLHVAKSGDLVK